MKEKTKIFIVSGPGGVGKTTILNTLFKKKNIKGSVLKGITVTSRPKREKEEDGRDYFFVDDGEFLWLKKKKFFLESQKILNYHYGTPKMFFTLAKKKKKDLVLCLDVEGTMYLKKNFKGGRIITVFISAPNKKELYERMGKREENKDLIKKKVALATKEAKFAKEYEFVVVNKDIKSTLKKLEKIILTNQ